MPGSRVRLKIVIGERKHCFEDQMCTKYGAGPEVEEQRRKSKKPDKQPMGYQY